MPRAGYSKEKLAEEILREEEVASGAQPGPRLSQAAQRAEGCDFFSTPKDGGAPHRVEVKGWGAPLRQSDGRPSFAADINPEQLCHARQDANWRLEIVANLDAVIAKTGKAKRLTLSGRQAAKKARPAKYWIDLDELV